MIFHVYPLTHGILVVVNEPHYYFEKCIAEKQCHAFTTPDEAFAFIKREIDRQMQLAQASKSAPSAAKTPPKS